MSARFAWILNNFPVISGVIIVAAATALGVLYRDSVNNDLTAVAERNNIALTRAFANVVWPEIEAFLPAAATLPRDDLAQHPKIAEIRRIALSTMRDVPVLKVKLYDLNGLTVFSTDPTQIGEDKRGNVGYQAARQGHVASELTHRGSFSAFEQVVEDRDVLSSYIPIQSADGAVQAVFEIYYDVTEIIHRIKRTQYLQITVIALTFLLLYVIIFQVVRHRDRLSRDHHIEQLRLTRKAMAAEEVSRTKSAILANMSHELLTPLNAILGFADVMRLQHQGPLGSAKYVEYVDDILKSGRHLLSVVGNVLDLSRVEAGEAELSCEPVALTPLIDECLARAVQRPGAGPAIDRSEAPECPALFVDIRRFRQVLDNLLSNAVKYTPANGRVAIRSQPATDGGIVITITDTGKGMAQESVATALTPFGRDGNPYVRRSGGFGLGLPLAQSFVQLHGGTLNIDSMPDRGTRIEIWLPASCVMSTTPVESTGT